MSCMVLMDPPAFARCIWLFLVVTAVDSVSLDPDEWARQYLDWKAGILRIAVPSDIQVHCVRVPNEALQRAGFVSYIFRKREARIELA
jgi:hypothetical protein